MFFPFSIVMLTSQQTFVLMKTSFVLSSKDVFMTSSRRLDENKYILINHTCSEDVFKTSSRRLAQDQYIRLVDTSSRRLQDIFKTSCQDVFKTFSRRLQDVLEKRLQDIFKTSCKDIFKTLSRHIIKLNCSCQHVFEKHSTRF